MSDDLKARLRGYRPHHDCDCYPMNEEAADVLDAKDARIEELGQERDRAVDTLNAQLSDEQAWAQNAARERDAALAEVERLRKGLEHIMKRGDAWCRERNAPGAYRRGLGDAAEEYRHMARQVLAQHPPAGSEDSHTSDCAVHDAPAYKAGKCTCGYQSGDTPESDYERGRRKGLEDAAQWHDEMDVAFQKEADRCRQKIDENPSAHVIWDQRWHSNAVASARHNEYAVAIRRLKEKDDG